MTCILQSQVKEESSTEQPLHTEGLGESEVFTAQYGAFNSVP